MAISYRPRRGRANVRVPSPAPDSASVASAPEPNPPHHRPTRWKRLPFRLVPNGWDPSLVSLRYDKERGWLIDGVRLPYAIGDVYAVLDQFEEIVQNVICEEEKAHLEAQQMAREAVMLHQHDPSRFVDPETIPGTYAHVAETVKAEKAKRGVPAMRGIPGVAVARQPVPDGCMRVWESTAPPKPRKRGKAKRKARR